MKQLVSSIVLASSLCAAATGAAEIEKDVVYGRKHGMALTLDAFRPDSPNGAGVIFIASGNWESPWVDPEIVPQTPNPFGKLLDKGFTVFSVRHGSSPFFRVPDAINDVKRAVRFVRANAEDYDIEPSRIGVCGTNSGGHLALVLGTTGDDGNASQGDPVDNASSRAGAVVAYSAPSDLTPLLNSKRYPAMRFGAEIVKDVSPVFQASADDAPTLLIVGLQDKVFSPQHSESMRDALRAESVPSEIVSFRNASQRLEGKDSDEAAEALVNWFTKYLLDEDPKERMEKAAEERRKNAPPTLSLMGEWALVLKVNNDGANYTLKIERESRKLKAALISPRSGEYPAESISYDSGDFTMRIRRSYEGQEHDFIYDYKGTLSLKDGLRGTVAVSEDGGSRSGAGTFSATRKK